MQEGKTQRFTGEKLYCFYFAGEKRPVLEGISRSLVERKMPFTV